MLVLGRNTLRLNEDEVNFYSGNQSLKMKLIATDKGIQVRFTSGQTKIDTTFTKLFPETNLKLDGHDVIVRTISKHGRNVSFGFDAPDEVNIVRGEIDDRANS